MWGPHGGSTDTSERRDRTELGYRRFRCRTCKRELNERTGTSVNHLQSPTAVGCLGGLWRVRDKLSLRDLPEMFLERGLGFPPAAGWEGEAQLAPRGSETLRQPRRGRIGPSWDVDETFRKVQGRSVYLSRAIEREGNLVDVLLSEKRDTAAAEAFFRSARAGTARVPERVTSEGHDAYPGASKAALGEEGRQRVKRYLNNHREQDQRGIKQRRRPRGGVTRVESAQRVCRVHDAVRNFLRPRSRHHAVRSLAQRRVFPPARTRILLPSLAAA
jgi:putative transposase